MTDESDDLAAYGEADLISHSRMLWATQGRTKPTLSLDMMDYVKTNRPRIGRVQLRVSHSVVVQACVDTPRQIIEIAKLTGMHLNSVKVLVADLVDAGLLVIAHQPRFPEEVDIDLLLRVREGLVALK